MQIIEKSLSEIRPYENNPRKNDAAVEYVANSIREFGWKVPIVIDKDGVIIAGHTRYKAAKKLGMKTAPCIMADDLTEDQVKAYRLADNKVGEFAEWDFDALEEELAGIEGINMADFGFEVSEEKEPVHEDDYNPQPPKNPNAKHGDIYQLGRHRLMCGDSTSIDDVQTLVGGAQIDMLLTDPPYNVDYHAQAGAIANDNMEDGAFRQFLTDAFTAAKSVMKPGAAFHIWHADSEGYNFRGAARDAGLKVRQCLIWVKNSIVLGRQDFQWQHEPCLDGENEEEEDETYDPALYGWKDGAAHRWYKKRRERTVLYFDKPLSSKEHPTMKPVLLFNYEMECNTKEGDNVLDLFGGSGTTAIAAEQNGRNAFIMELDPKYVDVIVDRWEKLTGRKAVLIHDGA